MRSGAASTGELSTLQVFSFACLSVSLFGSSLFYCSIVIVHDVVMLCRPGCRALQCWKYKTSKATSVNLMLLFLIGHTHLSDNEQTVRSGGGGSCAAADQLFPLQAVWQVSKKF